MPPQSRKVSQPPSSNPNRKPSNLNAESVLAQKEQTRAEVGLWYWFWYFDKDKNSCGRSSTSTGTRRSSSGSSSCCCAAVDGSGAVGAVALVAAGRGLLDCGGLPSSHRSRSCCPAQPRLTPSENNSDSQCKRYMGDVEDPIIACEVAPSMTQRIAH